MSRLATHWVAPSVAAMAVLTPAAVRAEATAGACQVRTSVLRSYAPFGPALESGERLTAAAGGGGEAAGALLTFDAAFAGALAAVPADEEAAFVLTDAERIVEGMERCADALAVPRRRVARAAAALENGYRRNQATMLSPAYAERLHRSPRARAVLEHGGRGDAIAVATDVKAANDKMRIADRIAEARASEERQRLAAIEAEAQMRIENERAEAQARIENARAEAQARIEHAQAAEFEAVWKRNASAPGPGQPVCDNRVAFDHRGRPRDAAWFGLLEGEVGRCKRISDRRNGVYYVGLALGTPVTDEQMGHAVGRVTQCLADTEGKRRLDAVNDFLSGWVGLHMRPVWRERMAGNRRIVQIRCETAASAGEFDLHGATSALNDTLRIDAYSYVEFDLVGGVLQAVKVHYVLTNDSRSETFGNTTTVYCSPLDAQADSFAAAYRTSGWRQIARVPYNYVMQNDAITGAFAGPQSARTGRWYTFQRSAVFIDLFNARYTAPVLGRNGSCNGGAIDEYAMLGPAHARRVKLGVSVAW